MPFLCVSTRILAHLYHGRADDGEPEWPPSPLRLFQGLVAAAAPAAGRPLAPEVDRALRWLERQLPPSIVAPEVTSGGGYRLSVPNNAMDIVARAWTRGADTSTGDANPATHRAMKLVRPAYLRDAEVVHFLWRLDPSASEDAGTVARIARRLVVLGWGTDFVVGHGQIVDDSEVALLEGVAWTPRADGAEPTLRVPVAGTLDDVIRRHARFLTRVQANVFDPPPPLASFAPLSYRRDTVHSGCSKAIFDLIDDRTGRLRSFDVARRGLTLAGMMRHAVRVAAERSGWPESRVNRLVLGHTEARGDAHAPVQTARFAYVPLPSIERRPAGQVVGAVRRMMVALLGTTDNGAAAWARRGLPGVELIAADGRPVALLGRGVDDPVTRRYTGRARRWSSVTPVVLPGYDDPAHLRRRLARGLDPAEQKRLLGRLDDRTDSLLRKAIRQAGFAAELAEHARLDWRRTGFLAGTELADRYGVPDHLKRFPRVHVTIEWRDAAGGPVEVDGPCIVGGGRFYGLGLLATDDGAVDAGAR